LQKLHEGEYDAVILAMAGLNRLHAHATYTVPFEVDVIVPATGQGALAAETRTADTVLTQELREAFNDAETEMCVRCERAALRTLRGGCRSPIGIHAYFNNGSLVAIGSLGTVRAQVEATIQGPYDAEALGQRLALELEHLRDGPSGAPAERREA
jgi:hydroxymethylbilane synthase